MNEIVLFWEWFLNHEKEIYDTLIKNAEEWAVCIQEKLSAISSDLVFDIPFEKVNGVYQLILSADGDRNLFTTVDKIVKLQPELNYWKVVSLRPRTNQLDQAIDLDGLYLEYEDIFFQTTSKSFPIELKIYIRHYQGDDNRYIHGYFLLLDTLLGERAAVLDTITISVEPLLNNLEVKRFLELRALYDSLKESSLN
jgi:hypothetical protein